MPKLLAALTAGGGSGGGETPPMRPGDSSTMGATVGDGFVRAVPVPCTPAAYIGGCREEQAAPRSSGSSCDERARLASGAWTGCSCPEASVMGLDTSLKRLSGVATEGGELEARGAMAAASRGLRTQLTRRVSTYPMSGYG